MVITLFYYPERLVCVLYPHLYSTRWLESGQLVRAIKNKQTNKQNKNKKQKQNQNKKHRTHELIVLFHKGQKVNQSSVVEDKQ